MLLRLDFSAKFCFYRKPILFIHWNCFATRFYATNSIQILITAIIFRLNSKWISASRQIHLIKNILPIPVFLAWEMQNYKKPSEHAFPLLFFSKTLKTWNSAFYCMTSSSIKGKIGRVEESSLQVCYTTCHFPTFSDIWNVCLITTLIPVWSWERLYIAPVRYIFNSNCWTQSSVRWSRVPPRQHNISENFAVKYLMWIMYPSFTLVL